MDLAALTACLNDAIRPALPQRRDVGIGLIGAGGIVQHGHMPAYRKAGFNVVAVTSRTLASAERMQQQWGIPRATADWRHLVDQRDVAVLDVSYPFDEERLAIVRAAAQAGKHVLLQKPLAHSLAVAQELVDTAARGGIQLAVNHNARWSPQYRAARVAVTEGWLGPVHWLTHELVNNQDAMPWFNTKWYAQQPRFQVLEYAIHHLDLMRFWTGAEPLAVQAALARKDGQASRGEMLAAILLTFPGQALGLVSENNAAFPAAPISSRFRVEGRDGVVCGNAMGEVTWQLFARDHAPTGLTVPLAGTWFPDGFMGTMGELLGALEEGRESSLSARDNLRTLELAFAAYDSAARG